MSSFVDLLKWIFEEWVRPLFPLWIVNEWEQGVLVRAGSLRRGKLLHHDNGIFGRGLHLAIPLLDQVECVDANWRTIGLSPQTFTLSGGKCVTLQGTVRWRVRDVGLLYKEVDDPDSSILEAVQVAIGDCAGACESVDDLRGAEFGDRCTKAAQAEVRGWGVEIKRIGFSTVVEAPALRHLVDKLED